MTKLETLALRMASARRKRLDAQQLLTRREKLTECKLEDALAKLSKARIEWRKASSAMWRLAEKMERGEA